MAAGDEWVMQQRQITDLSQKMDKLSDIISTTTVEMARTREIIRDYNGLREKLELQGRDIFLLKENRSQHEQNMDHLRKWGGWAAAGVTLILYLVRLFHG